MAPWNQCLYLPLRHGVPRTSQDTRKGCRRSRSTEQTEDLTTSSLFWFLLCLSKLKLLEMSKVKAGLQGSDPSNFRGPSLAMLRRARPRPPVFCPLAPVVEMVACGSEQPPNRVILVTHLPLFSCFVLFLISKGKTMFNLLAALKN